MFPAQEPKHSAGSTAFFVECSRPTGMPISAAPHRGLERGTPGNDCSADQPFEFWRFHHCGHSPPTLADRSVFQNPQTEFENQNLRRHFRKRPAHPDLDSTHCDAPAAMASLSVEKKLVLL